MVFIQFWKDLPGGYLYLDIAFNFISSCTILTIKILDYKNKKKVFYEDHKNENYADYIQKLVEFLHNMVIGVKQNEVLFMNNFTRNFLENKFKYNNYNEDIMLTEMKNNSSPIIENNENNKSLFLFFKILKLTFLDDSNNMESKSFTDCLEEIFSNKIYNENFSRIGVFTLKNEIDTNWFEIYVRKMKFEEDVVEIQIYDVTELKNTEKIKIETYYKQKILSKITHEFKTPLITINTLTDNILMNKIYCNLKSFKVFSDENLIKQILLNFISNSVKFTHSGCIIVEVNYISDLNSLKIGIKDSGLGIKKEDYPMIFKNNIELDVDQVYNDQGCGIGLSICNNIAKQLDHIIGFESVYGKGSEFYILLKCKKENTSLFIPVNHSHKNNNLVYRRNDIEINNLSYETKQNILSYKSFSSENNNEIPSTNRKNFDLIIDPNFYYFMDKSIILDTQNIKNDTVNITNFNFSIAKTLGNDNKFKVLVIDDHKLVRDNTKNLIKSAFLTLKLQDYEIIEGSDGIDLLNFVRLDHEGKIKIIFTDENMEYINGSEAIKIMRKLEENKKIKNYEIASITAFDDNLTKKKILDSGANLVISKPASKSEILKAVQNDVSTIEL